MQLQGELVLRKKLSTVAAAAAKTAGVGLQDYRPPYRNALHAFYKICRDEGFRGIQAGLIPGLMYQVLERNDKKSEIKDVPRAVCSFFKVIRRSRFHLARGEVWPALGVLLPWRYH